jgi:hypothetical protein
MVTDITAYQASNCSTYLPVLMVRDAAACRLLSAAEQYSVVVITTQLLPAVHGALLRLQQVRLP